MKYSVAGDARPTVQARRALQDDIATILDADIDDWIDDESDGCWCSLCLNYDLEGYLNARPPIQSAKLGDILRAA